MLVIAIIFIYLAMFLYSIAIFSERITKRLKVWMVIVFSSALFCDIVGTATMFYIAKVKFELTLHCLSGYGALVFMAIHLIWAILALRYDGKTAIYFHRCSVFAWCVWLLAFISGAQAHM